MLRRRIGEGSFVGAKKPQTKEELVEWLKHLHAYKYAKNFVDRDSLILDVGCGTGYGVNELATESNITVGIDIWREGIKFCAEKYGHKAHFAVASALDLPCRDNLFDLVVPFQVIEHIESRFIWLYLNEVRRVLKQKRDWKGFSRI